MGAKITNMFNVNLSYMLEKSVSKLVWNKKKLLKKMNIFVGYFDFSICLNGGTGGPPIQENTASWILLTFRNHLLKVKSCQFRGC